MLSGFIAVITKFVESFLRGLLRDLREERSMQDAAAAKERQRIQDRANEDERKAREAGDAARDDNVTDRLRDGRF